MLAVEGKVDFLGKTNPFGARPKPAKKKPKRNVEQQRSRFAVLKAEAKTKAMQCQTQ